MATLAAFLVFVMLSALGGVTVARFLDQLHRDQQRLTFQLSFPSNLTPEDVAGWLRSFAGTLRTDSFTRAVRGAPSVVLEVIATHEGINHRLKVPWQYERYLLPKLYSMGIRLTPEDEFVKVPWKHAVEIGLRASHRQLRINDALQTNHDVMLNFGHLAENEVLMMQWIITSAQAMHKVDPKEASSLEHRNVLSYLSPTKASKAEVTERNAKLDEVNLNGIVRVAARANTVKKSQQLVNGVVTSFKAVGGPAHQFYARFTTWQELQRRIERAATPLVAPIQLAVPEVMALMGWRLGEFHVPGLPGSISRTIPAPTAVPSVGRVFGVSNFHGAQRRVALAHDEAFKHMHLLSSTGGGKSVALGNMFKQDVKAGYGAVVIENKGDLFRAALDYIPPNRLDDVIVFDVSDTEYPLGFNILEQGDKATIVDELLGVFNEMYRDHPSLWTQEVMYHGLHTLVEDKDATFVDLMALVSPTREEVDWSQSIRSRVRDPQLKRFWQELEAKGKLRQEQRIEPLASRVWPMTRSKLMNIVGQSRSSFNMADVVRDNKILLVNLSGIEKGSANLMGTLLLNILWQTVKRNPPTKGMFLYLDEFHHYMNIPVDVEQMLVEARSMRLGMVLAHQYLDQLKNRNLEEAIMSNAKTKVAFQLGADDARTIANNFGKSVTQDDFQHLGKFEAISRVSTNVGLSAPFTLVTLPPERGYGLADEVLKRSRQRYGRPVQQVQDAIQQRRSGANVVKPKRPKPKADGWGNLAND